MKLPLVSVCTITYNHAPYIKDCIEGVLMQKTDFDIEFIIHDDASTDGTKEIAQQYAEKYPDLITPIYQEENQYSKGIKPMQNFVFPRAKGKYIALCEGDDYWTDPFKLQKQVDFLEANPEYGLVHTDVDIHYIKKRRKVLGHHKKAFRNEQLSGDMYDILLCSSKTLITTCTVCFRKHLIDDINLSQFSRYTLGDGPTWLHIASKSLIGYIPDVTAVHNRLPYSATSGRSFEDSLKHIRTGEMIVKDFNKIRPITLKPLCEIEQKFLIMKLNLCFNHRPKGNYHRELYKKIDSKNRTPTTKIKYMLISLRVNRLISKVLLLIVRLYENIVYKPKLHS